MVRLSPPNNFCKFVKTDSMVVDDVEINRGDPVKVRNVIGKFSFVSFVQAPDGNTWVDVQEHEGGLRSFETERIKVVHGRRTRTSTKSH
mgnify:CR=1 FL=1